MNMHQEQSALTQGVNGPRSPADTGPGPGAGDAGDEGCRVRHRSEAGRVSPRRGDGAALWARGADGEEHPLLPGPPSPAQAAPSSRTRQ